MHRTRTWALLVLLIFSLLQLIVPGRQFASSCTAHNRAETVRAESGLLHPEPLNPAAKEPKVFTATYFEPTKQLQPIQTKAFTADEFIKLVPEKIVLKGGVRHINIRKRTQTNNANPTPPKYINVTIPLDDYISELNKYEVFLNKLGYTLRDGKLKTPDPAVPLVQTDMGTILRLRNRAAVEPNRNRNSVLVDEIIYDPDPFSRFIPHGTKPGDIRANPGGRTTNPAENRKDPAFFNPRLRPDALRTRNLLLAGGPEIGFSRVLKVQNGDVPPCGDSGKPTGGPALKPLCNTPEAKNHPLCKGDGTGASVGSTEAIGQVCPGTEKAPGDPACLFDGQMYAVVAPAYSITLEATGGNGWFRALVGIDLATKNQQQGTEIGLDNWGNASASVDILGTQFKILEAKSTAKFITGVGPTANTELNVLGVNYPNKFEKKIEGPGAVFMVGPVPFKISSDLYLGAGLDENKEPFSGTPPTSCSPTTGSLTMLLNGNVEARVTLQAAFDAIVASAGIEGHLLLVNNKFGGRVVTEVTPGTNTVKVTPSLLYDSQYLAGKVYLFAELDLAVYTKKWSVLIFEHQGIDPPEYNFPKPPKTFVFASKN